MGDRGVNMSFIEKDVLKEMIRENLKTLYRKTLENATAEELYQAAVFAIRDVITDNPRNPSIVSSIPTVA